MEAVIAEPGVVENNSEVETNQLPGVGHSNNLRSNDILVPIVSNDIVSTADVDISEIAESLSGNIPSQEQKGCSQGPDSDLVSSSTESSITQCRDALPSVNHQMVVVPNMEPYLEDGSLDGTPKELQDPTSSNGVLVTEDTLNPDQTSNHFDSAEPSVHNIHKNGKEQQDLNLDICHSEEQSGGVLRPETIEETCNDEVTPDGEPVASCSSEAIEESSTEIHDNGAVITNPERYQTEIVPVTSEDAAPEEESISLQSATPNVEHDMGEVQRIEQFGSLQTNTTQFTTGDTCVESDVTNIDQNLVTSLTHTDMASHSEVSESGVDFTTANEANTETHFVEISLEPACETNEEVGKAAIVRNDFADSSTLEIERNDLVSTEPDALIIQQQDVETMPYQESVESFSTDESVQQDNGILSNEIETVDSSVDHTVQPEAGPVPEADSHDAGDYQRECVESDTIVNTNIGIDQVDSGTTRSDFVDDGVAESGLTNEEVMETDQIPNGTPDHDIMTIAPDPVNGEAAESTGSQGIIPDHDVATTEGDVIYATIESGAIEEETTEAQTVQTHVVEAHSMETQPVEDVERQIADGEVDSSYYMNPVDLEQPDGTGAERVDASADIENATSSHLDQHFEDNEVDNPQLINMDTNLPNPTAVCEADSSAAGMEDTAYETHQMVDTQNVYVVENDGRLTLNSVEQSNSMNAYHNAENAMLVEMAPLSTDGSYADSQVSYVDAGQEGMITDAQAAELLMRVSEQRPMSLQSLQQDSSSSGPYVQVQLAQTVEGITHLVEVPVSALAGYCLPSSLVYSTSGGGTSTSGGSEMTWVQMNENSSGSIDQHHLRTENKFSDIVSASIEAIGFPESSTPGANILSQAEQILIASENAAQESAAAAASSNFEFDESSNSSLTLTNDKATTSYPRPKRESIESRIHKLLRGASAPGLEVVEEPMQMPSKASPRNVKLGSLPPAKPPVSTSASTSATVTLSLSPNQAKRPGRLVTAINSMGRTVTIPTVFTATNQSANKPSVSALPPGSVDYFMPRGVSKRKAQTFKASKINTLNPNSIDVEPAPPEETQVKLAMGGDTIEEDDLHKDDDDFNRAVLLQARQRLQSEQGTNHRFTGRASSSVYLSTPVGAVKEEEDVTPAKRVRLSFPPEKYANLENISSSYMAELQTPKLTYTIPRTRQVRPKIIKETVSIDNLPKPDKEITVRLPWMDEEEDLKRKRTPPRIIRQTTAAEPKPKEIDLSAFDIDPDSEQSDQVIVIGLDETGQQPSEEQLTAIIQAAMTKRENLVLDRPAPSQSTQRTSNISIASNNAHKTYAMKRKLEEENGVETEENEVRLKVIRTYDRGLGVPRKRPPRSKKLSTFLEIFEFDEDEDEDEDEEEVDDLERFSQALVDEENAIRDKEQTISSKKPNVSPSNDTGTSISTFSRGRGRGKGRGSSHGNIPRPMSDGPGITASPTIRGGRSRGRPPRASKMSSRRDIDAADSEETIKGMSSEDEFGAFGDDDDDYKPRGRGRGRGRGQSRGRRGRPRSVSKEELIEAEDEDEEEEEALVPGMPSKPCPLCEERFTTREGFLEHIVLHSSAKCLIEFCEWTNPIAKEKTRMNREQLKQHMLRAHIESIPTA